MNKNILITSVKKQHRSNYKYLSYGSVNIFDKVKKKNFLFSHPWDGQKKYSKHSSKIKKYNQVILKKLSKILNKHNKENKDLRYWKIYIGPWLHTFIVSYYEKYLLIQNLQKFNGKLIIPVVNLNISLQIPKNFFQFFNNHMQSDNWNKYLFSYIFLKQKRKKNFFIKKIASSFENNYNYKNNNNFLSISFLKNILLKIINLIFILRVKNQPLVFFDTYLSNFNKIFLMIKNFSFPTIFYSNINTKKVDYRLRESLKKKASEKNIFLRDLLKSSIEHLPIDFLENFSLIKNKIFSSNIPKNPKIILTANGVLSSSMKSMYIAECVSKGSKLIIAQHGGRYGNIKNMFHKDYEIDIADYFISWGSEKNKKIKNIGMIKSIKKKYSKNQSMNNTILFLMVTKGRYPRVDDSEYNNFRKIYNYYSEICPNFYKKLNYNLKSKLIYRTAAKNFWNEKKILKKKCKLSLVDSNKHKSDFLESASSSRIVVCSYFSTTFFELLAANIPVILFTPFSHDVYNKKTLKSFKKMKNCKMFFNNEKDAAIFINKKWERIYDWWWSKNVQDVRKNILKNFSILNNNLIYDVQKLISKSYS